jgi:uncharacterized protein (TIGR02466 family)
MSISRNDWFPTPVWHFTIDDHQQLNLPLLQEIKAEQLRDQRGEKWSNVLGWHSVNNLHTRTVFTGFNKIVQENILEIASFLRWDLQKFILETTTCWAIVNGKMASNSVHNHPNSILSGVYYLQAPENCGSIYFSDPRPASQMLIPPVEEFNLWTFPKVSYKPHAGTMLLFPSWLLHGVEMNMSEELRISLSFNIGMSPKKAKSQKSNF